MNTHYDEWNRLFLKPLTRQEKRLLRIRRDHTLMEASHLLGIAYNTAKKHMTHINKKLGVSSGHESVLLDYVMQTELGEP